MKYKLLFLYFSLYYCYLFIPLQYKPIYRYNNDSHPEIYNSIINTKLYAKIYIGIPKQNIEIPLDFNSNDFYISDINFKYFDSNGKLYTDIKFYDSSKSTSLSSLEDIYYDGNNFFLGEYSKDIFYFNETKIDLEFYLPIKLKNEDSGAIGLLLNTISFNSERSFLKTIKNKYLIENYYWSILYFDDNIFLFIGKLPHELNYKLTKFMNNDFDYNFDNMTIINAKVENGIVKNIININKIKIHQNEKEYCLDDIKTIELNYHSGGIEFPIILLHFYENIFAEYIYKKKCFKEELHEPKNIYFFYCYNDNLLINEIKHIFPVVQFCSNINFDFYLEFNDLFYTKGNFIYFLIFFDDSNNKNISKITMGKPFMKKYKFSFNPEKKQIFLYSNNKKKNENDDSNLNELNNNENTFKIIIASICAFIFICLFIYLFTKIYLLKKINRKKKANELEDEFEYE